MPHTGKRTSPGTSMNEARQRIDLISQLSGLPAKAQKLVELTTKLTGIMLCREARTLEKDRKARDDAKAKKKKIDGRSYASLPYIPPAEGEREIKYRAYDVLKMLGRRSGGSKGTALARGIPKQDDPRAHGFRSWLAHGTADEEWPCCIQPDGRPLPIAQAIATGADTSETEHLTIGAYCERLADAVSLAFAKSEREELEKAAKAPKKKPAKKASAKPAKM